MANEPTQPKSNIGNIDHSNQSPSSSVKKWDIQKAILAFVFGVLAIIVGGVLLGLYNNRIRTMSCYTSTNNSIISRPDLGEKKIEVLVDGKPIENFSTISLYLVNDTDIDYEKLKFKVTFIPAVDGLPIRLLRTDVNPVSPSFAEIDPPIMPVITEFRCQYEIGVANRGRPAFYATYIFDAQVAPKIAVAVEQKGLEVSLQELSRNQTGRGMLAEYVISSLVAVMLCAAFAFGRGYFRNQAKLAKLDAECNDAKRSEAAWRLQAESLLRVSVDAERREELLNEELRSEKQMASELQNTQATSLRLQSENASLNAQLTSLANEKISLEKRLDEAISLLRTAGNREG